eukprot:SM000244S08557  [mRNA]  locus=s244:47391:48261:- [translate_table: standard]
MPGAAAGGPGQAGATADTELPRRRRRRRQWWRRRPRGGEIAIRSSPPPPPPRPGLRRRRRGPPAGPDLVGRAVSTAIYFLLPAGSVSRLHRMPAAEVWHFYLGEPLTVVELGEDGNVKQTVLGKDLAAGQQLQHVVPPGVWFGSHPTLEPVGTTSARDPEAHFSLVGCTVAPAFAFDDFELADRAQLLAEYPGLAELVTHLT